MQKYWNHFRHVIRHKYYVFMEMKDYGLVWQGIMHDMSKFHPAEFRLAKFYVGTQSPINIEKRECGYSKSWLHHFHNNRHHWEYWFDVTTGKIAPIPKKYLQEMVCDIIGASKAYNGKNWTPDMPAKYLTTQGKHPQSIVDILLPMLQEKLR